MLGRAKLQRPQAGFSIIEVLFALVLLGMVLVGIAVLMTRSLVVAADARYRNIGNDLAQEVLELYHRERTLSSWTEFTTAGAGSHCVLSDAKDFSETTTFITGACVAQGVTVSGILFQRDVVAVSTPGKLEATVTVQWKSGRTGNLETQSIVVKQDFTNWL